MKSKFSGIKMIMGLGNPEPEYKNTYHNAGKLMVDYLLKKHVFGSKDETTVFRKKISGNFESLTVNGLTLIKPTNYMNTNGSAAKAAMKSLNIKADSLLMAHDDSDIEIGKYKISSGRGSAGHNGVQSVIENLGTKDFWRIRIGIGKSGKINKVKAGELVLQKITAKDKELLSSAFDAAISEIFGEDG
jgi:peptidyl-tRNA hydrolase, PTH1 family